MTEKLERKISLSNFFLFSIILVGIGVVVGMVAGQNNQIEDIAEAHDILCHQDKDCVAWLNENFVSEVQRITEMDKLEDAIAAPHIEFDGIASSISTIKTDIAILKADVRALEAADNTGSSSSSSGDFDLMTCSDFNCVDEENRFNQGDTIYIRGDNPTNDRSLELRIYDPDNVRIHDANISTVPNSPFIAIYEIENDAEDGTYRVVVELDRDEDEINFIVD